MRASSSGEATGSGTAGEEMVSIVTRRTDVEVEETSRGCKERMVPCDQARITSSGVDSARFK